jgi:hypothetical protein
VNDIETRIRELVNDTVDAELGPRRVAPPFDPRRNTKPRRWAPWVTPLLAAASVAAVAAATVTVAHVASEHRHTPPATSVAPTPDSPTPPPSPASSPATSAAPTPDSPTPPPSPASSPARVSSAPPSSSTPGPGTLSSSTVVVDGLRLVPGPYGFLVPSSWQEAYPLTNWGGSASDALFSAGPVHAPYTGMPLTIEYWLDRGDSSVYNRNGQPILSSLAKLSLCPAVSWQPISSNALTFTCAPVSGMVPTGILLAETPQQGIKQLLVTLSTGQHEATTRILDSLH